MPSVVNIDIQYNDLVVVHYIENEGVTLFGRQNSGLPKISHSNLWTYEYITTSGKRNFADMMKNPG